MDPQDSNPNLGIPNPLDLSTLDLSELTSAPANPNLVQPLSNNPAKPLQPVQSAPVKAMPVKAMPVKAQPVTGQPLTAAQPVAQVIAAQPIMGQQVGPGISPQQFADQMRAAAQSQGATPAPLGAAMPVTPEVDLEAVVASAQRRKFWWTAAPSWAISLFVHAAVLFILAAITLDPVRDAISILQGSAGSQAEAIESFDLQTPSEPIETPSNEDPITPPSPTVNQVSMPQLTTPTVDMAANLEALDVTNVTEGLLPSTMLSPVSAMTSSLASRSSASVKSEMLEKYGGNAASEKAVAMALKWIADHQAPNGAWTFAHSRFCKGGQCKDEGTKFKAINGATAMAILPFLGAGQTHLQGQYKDTVKKGLGFLISNMKATPGAIPHGSWHEPDGNMYSHGLAAITVCEAFAMTKDPDLLQPAQLAINYLVYAQDQRGGGWRYSPNQPGDTSVVGWCVMALKSGAMGNLSVPHNSFRGANNFLDFVSTNEGAYYGYDKPTANIQGREATVAIGLLCRMYMGWQKDKPAFKQGVEFLSKRGPDINNLYYSYYATQVMRQYGGAEWEKWNVKMRDDLLKAQVADGHAAGSWYSEGGHGKEGGRLYATSMSTMILEVYYRHMPLYSEKSASDDFEL